MTSFVIDYFELPTSSMDKSRDFFRDAFGWGNKSYGPGYSEVLDAGVLGGLNGAPEGRSSTPVLGIRTDDIVAAQAAVEKAGGTISIAPHDYPGGRRFFFREPGGSEFLVYWPNE
ncbi:MAG: VOC family protein [Hyphomicrobiales bacterium]|nr:MAG: VOC family protein [Hyphomicrobiales bacterium]